MQPHLLAKSQKGLCSTQRIVMMKMRPSTQLKEICDGIDQDCDLTIDEPDSLDDPSISKCTFMYRDVDADSYVDVDYMNVYVRKVLIHL